MAVKYTSAENKELQRQVKNFNARLRRLQKSGKINPKLLPDKATVSDIKSRVNNRRDLKRELNSLKSFTNRSAKVIVTSNGGAYTQWQRQNIEQKIKVVNRREAQYRKKHPSLKTTKKSDKPQKIVYDFDGKSIADIKKFEEMLNKKLKQDYYSKREQQLRDNFIKSLITVYGDNDTTKDLINMINNMSLKDFITLYYKNENVDIDDFNYDMLIDYSYKFEKLNEIFGAYK